MRGVARLGDRTHGVCYAHKTPLTIGGSIITASSDSDCNSRGVARLGDTVQADCGHTSNIVTASENADCNGRGVARLGDNVSGVYVATIITASVDTTCN
jgi:uncharacterized Zn-binding protein involved in type VI secretion